MKLFFTLTLILGSCLAQELKVHQFKSVKEALQVKEINNNLAEFWIPFDLEISTNKKTVYFYDTNGQKIREITRFFSRDNYVKVRFDYYSKRVFITEPLKSGSKINNDLGGGRT